jgi:hypothetical protein
MLLQVGTVHEYYNPESPCITSGRRFSLVGPNLRSKAKELQREVEENADIDVDSPRWDKKYCTTQFLAMTDD